MQNNHTEMHKAQTTKVNGIQFCTEVDEGATTPIRSERMEFENMLVNIWKKMRGHPAKVFSHGASLSGLLTCRGAYMYRCLHMQVK